MELKLTVSSETVSQETLQRQVASLRELVNKCDDIELMDRPKLPPDSAKNLECKFEPVSLTTLAVAFLTGGAAVAVINAIRAVLPGGKDSTISYELDIGDGGGKLRLAASGLTRDQATLLIERWNGLVADIRPTK